MNCFLTLHSFCRLIMNSKVTTHPRVHSTPVVSFDHQWCSHLYRQILKELGFYPDFSLDIYKLATKGMSSKNDTNSSSMLFSSLLTVKESIRRRKMSSVLRKNTNFVPRGPMDVQKNRLELSYLQQCYKLNTFYCFLLCGHTSQISPWCIPLLTNKKQLVLPSVCYLNGFRTLPKCTVFLCGSLLSKIE